MAVRFRRGVQSVKRIVDGYAMPQQAPHALPPGDIDAAVAGALITHGDQACVDIDRRLALTAIAAGSEVNRCDCVGRLPAREQRPIVDRDHVLELG